MGRQPIRRDSRTSFAVMMSSRVGPDKRSVATISQWTGSTLDARRYTLNVRFVSALLRQFRPRNRLELHGRRSHHVPIKTIMMNSALRRLSRLLATTPTRVRPGPCRLKSSRMPPRGGPFWAGAGPLSCYTALRPLVARAKYPQLHPAQALTRRHAGGL